MEMVLWLSPSNNEIGGRTGREEVEQGESKNRVETDEGVLGGGVATRKGEVYVVGVGGGEGVLACWRKVENGGSLVVWCLFSLFSQDKFEILWPWGFGLTTNLGGILQPVAWCRFYPREKRRGYICLLACLGIN